MAYYPPSEAPDATTTTKGKVQLAGDLSGTAAAPTIGADKVVDSMLVYGKLRTRQGGSATNWSTTGTNTYDYSGTNTFIQCGAKATSGSTTVTFPTAFNQVPTVVATVITAAAANTWVRISAITATTFTYQTLSDTGTGANENINWIAIGE